MIGARQSLLSRNRGKTFADGLDDGVEGVACSQDELARLWEAVQSVEGEYCGIPAALWWHAWHAISWDVGERIGALLQLKWSDVTGTDSGPGRAAGMFFHIRGMPEVCFTLASA